MKPALISLFTSTAAELTDLLDKREQTLNQTEVRFPFATVKKLRATSILNQSKVKPKPIVSCPHMFSRASRQLHAFASSFDWFIGSLCPLRLARLITFEDKTLH